MPKGCRVIRRQWAWAGNRASVYHLRGREGNVTIKVRDSTPIIVDYSVSEGDQKIRRVTIQFPISIPGFQPH